MGIKLDISVETPLSDNDRDILAGISVMVLAIANRQDLVDQAQQEQDDEDATEGAGPLYCGTVAPDALPLLETVGRRRVSIGHGCGDANG